MVKNELIEVNIVDYNSEGFGVAKLDGQVIFVRGGARGDLASVRVLKTTPSVAWGKVEELITQSEHRCQPKCPRFPRCGGCDLQHLSYDETMFVKRGRVERALTRLGGLENPPPIEQIPAEKTFEYRNKAIFPVSRTGDGVTITGFYRRNTHTIVPNNCCAVNAPELDAAAAATREYLDELNVSVYGENTQRGLARHLFVRSAGDGVYAALVINGKTLPKWQVWLEKLQKAVPNIKVILTVENRRHDNVIIERDNAVTLWGDGKHALDFMQVNAEQTEKLYNKAVEYAELSTEDIIADLYCGQGALTLKFAERCKTAYGAEISAVREDTEKARFFQCDVADFAPPEPVDVVCIDPPRSGLSAAALANILKLNPKRINYISCNPETLARDIKLLGYTPQSDTLPQFVHRVDMIHPMRVNCA